MLPFQLLALASIKSVVQQEIQRTTRETKRIDLECPCSFDKAFRLETKVNASNSDIRVTNQDQDCCNKKLFHVAKMDKMLVFMFLAGLRCCASLPTQRTTTKAPSNPDAELLKMYEVFPADCGRQMHNASLPTAPPTPLPTKRRRTKRIVGGQAVLRGQYPWQIALWFRGQHYCGGAVVHSKWVVTASHCFNPFTSANPDDWTVTIGDHNLTNNHGRELFRNVTSITTHEKYKSMWFEGIHDTPPKYDIAVLELEEPIPFNDHIQPICLLRPGTSFSSNAECYISGWGHTEWSGSQPPELNHVLVPLVSHDTCNKPQSYNGTIHDTAICAGYPQGLKDSCEFDSGGALVCPKESLYYLFGLASWGHECARAHKYGVYSRMEKLTPWLVRHIAKRENTGRGKTVRTGDRKQSAIAAISLVSIIAVISLVYIIAAISLVYISCRRCTMLRQLQPPS